MSHVELKGSEKKKKICCTGHEDCEKNNLSDSVTRSQFGFQKRKTYKHALYGLFKTRKNETWYFLTGTDSCLCSFLLRFSVHVQVFLLYILLFLKSLSL